MTASNMTVGTTWIYPTVPIPQPEGCVRVFEYVVLKEDADGKWFVWRPAVQVVADGLEDARFKAGQAVGEVEVGLAVLVREFK